MELPEQLTELIPVIIVGVLVLGALIFFSMCRWR